MKSRWIKSSIVFSVFVLCLLSVVSVNAQSGANFYEGKTIAFFAGSSAGGGTDLTARLIAKHLERYIPGKPTVLVVNKPGAGGVIAVNELYNVKKPDGLTMSTMNTGALWYCHR
jgi:tripartite-type tricarboxylate transporter receptor subunit TctC